LAQFSEKGKRIFLLSVIFIIIFLILIYRLYNIQIAGSSVLNELARKEHMASYILDGKRGIIFDRNLKKLAVNIESKSLFAMPYKIDDPDQLARLLSTKLGLAHQDIAEKLREERYFVWIARQLSEEQYEEIRKLQIDGLDFVTENKRYYPRESLAANLLGFVGIDNQGLEGLELYFDNELKGQPGLIVMERDATGEKIPLSIERKQPSRDGLSIVLTIDEVVQYITEEALNKAFEQYHPASAVAIVVNPKTGEILSMAVRPSFNINDFQNSTEADRRNRAITDSYEPGSTFKIFTIATALEHGYANLNDRFNCKGWINYRGTVIRDIDPHGLQYLTDIVKNSCNVGVIEVGTRIDENIFADSISKFGFGEKTRITLPGESPGLFRPVNQWSKISIASLSIGQEISVTPLQLVMATAAVANNGILMEPLLVNKILDEEYKVIRQYQPQEVRQAISPHTAKIMSSILQEVVDKGTGSRAKLEAYTAAGKTGTSQKFDFSLGRYSNKKFTSWFAGFAPVNDAEIAILVMLDEPKGSYYGGTVAAPVFQEIASQVLPYLSIPPE
jgi:cell division protein FtsI/penicillin-binding protein 2